MTHIACCDVQDVPCFDIAPEDVRSDTGMAHIENFAKMCSHALKVNILF
jgi:hypothetical protein